MLFCLGSGRRRALPQPGYVVTTGLAVGGERTFDTLGRGGRQELWTFRGDAGFQRPQELKKGTQLVVLNLIEGVKLVLVQ